MTGAVVRAEGSTHPRPQRRAGLYFLLDGGHIVYIGESECIDERVAFHARHKAFDRWLALELPATMSADERRELERAFIRSLRTRDNGEALAVAAGRKLDHLLTALADAPISIKAAPERARSAPRGGADAMSYTLRQAASASGLSVATLRRRAGEGRLRLLKVGARTLVCADSLRSLIAGAGLRAEP